jgi:hypothetical protein
MRAVGGLDAHCGLLTVSEASRVTEALSRALFEALSATPSRLALAELRPTAPARLCRSRLAAAAKAGLAIVSETSACYRALSRPVLHVLTAFARCPIAPVAPCAQFTQARYFIRDCFI